MNAFLGMGLLGSNFVRAMRKRGESVQVWNRTTDKAKALEAVGAVAFADPASAVRGAAQVHLTLRDDQTVDDVLEQARPGLDPGVIVIDHTTTSPTGTAVRAKRWADRGIAFQHAPVFMGPQNALEGTGVMLGSGDRARFDALSPTLNKMTGKWIYVGPQPERAAAFKLFGNLFLMALTAGLGDIFALGNALGIPPAEAQQLFEWFNPAVTMGPRIKRIIDADFEHPSWELTMARKDARLMMEEAQRGGRQLTLIPAVAKHMDDWIEKGDAASDWTIIAKDAVESK